MVTDDLTQWLHVDVKQRRREYWVLWDTPSEWSGAGSLTPCQEWFGPTLDKGVESAQTCHPVPKGYHYQRYWRSLSDQREWEWLHYLHPIHTRGHPCDHIYSIAKSESWPKGLRRPISSRTPWSCWNNHFFHYLPPQKKEDGRLDESYPGRWGQVMFFKGKDKPGPP